jgi:alkylhydroperoxidase family enzyme
MKRASILSTVALFALATCLRAEDSPSNTPKVIPPTRPEIKVALEALKDRQPRLTNLPTEPGETASGRGRTRLLPPTWGGGRGGGRTNADRNRDAQAGGAQTAGAAGRGARTTGNNGATTFDYVFSTSMFWIVSRADNCHYCLGHQELKLKNAGVEDDKIAALDCDWSVFDPRMQAALAYTRKLTLEPQLIGDADIAALKKQFSDAEIIELTRIVGGFNSTNRWTDGLGVPQGRSFGGGESTLVTPTSEKFRVTTSIVSPNTRAPRPPLPTAAEYAAAIEAAHRRQARVAIPSEADTRAALADVIGDRPALTWERVLAADGNASQVKTWNTVMTDDNLPHRLKAELAFVCAINNRAWYAAAHAAQRLAELGGSPAELTSLLAGDARGPAGPAAAHALAAKSTSSPHLITDADVAQVQKHYSDADTAMILQVICLANMFDRVTEALGLPLENGIAAKASSSP